MSRAVVVLIIVIIVVACTILLLYKYNESVKTKIQELIPYFKPDDDFESDDEDEADYEEVAVKQPEFELVKNIYSNSCMDSNGEAVYSGPCNKGNDYMLWKMSESGEISHKFSGKCLITTADKTVTMGNCDQSESQEWSKVGKSLTNKLHRGQCLHFSKDPDNGGKAPTMKQCAIDSHPTKSMASIDANLHEMKWDFGNDTSHLIKHKESDLCLDSEGTHVYFNGCSENNPYMLWKQTKDGEILHPLSGRCLHANAENVTIKGCDKSQEQKWTKKTVDGGKTVISSEKYPSKCLHFKKIDETSVKKRTPPTTNACENDWTGFPV
jgi:hypothetical protein